MNDTVNSCRQTCKGILEGTITPKPFPYLNYANKILLIGLIFSANFAIAGNDKFYGAITLIFTLLILFMTSHEYVFNDEIPESDHGFWVKNKENILRSLLIGTFLLGIKILYDLIAKP